MRKSLASAVVILLALAGVFFGWRFMSLGRFTLPTAEEYIAIARSHQDIVQAVYDYKAENGMLPEKLSDLVPRYLPHPPSDPQVSYYDGILSIHADVPHTYVCYIFLPGAHEGWSARGDFGTGPLPVKPPAATRPALVGEALTAARVAAYDRRIAREPKEMRHYEEKIAYLVSLGRVNEARASCRAAIVALPDWWRPRMGLAVLAPPEERDSAEADFRSWAEQYPSFINWWYVSRCYRDHGRPAAAVAALQVAVKWPLMDGVNDLYPPEAFAFDAASLAYGQKQYALVLEVVRVWSSRQGMRSNLLNDRFVFKAAAELALGQFAEAQADADRVRKGDRNEIAWAANLEQLLRAVEAKDQTFTYEPGRPERDWRLFIDPEYLY